MGHGIEQASFLISGFVFWWPVVQAWSSAAKRPEWSMLLYLFLATLPCDILSGFLVFCDRVVYPVYLSTPRLFGMSALEDQQCAGALMWTCVTVVYLIAGTIFTAHLLSPRSAAIASIPRICAGDNLIDTWFSCVIRGIPIPPVRFSNTPVLCTTRAHLPIRPMQHERSR